MRRVGIILTAGAALVLALVVPTVAEATGKSTTTDKSAEISAQGIGLDDEITAQGKRGGKHAKGGKHGRHGGKRDGYRHGRSRHGHHDRHYRHHRHHRGHYGYYGYYGHPYYGGGYYRGGYGCNYDYPCDRPGQTYDCTRYKGPDGQPAGDPHCKYDARCDCYYHSSDRTPERAQSQPAPEQNTQPAPEGQPAPPAQDPGPAPEQGQPAPDEGSPRPY